MYRLLVLCLCHGFLGLASSEEATTSVFEHCGNLEYQENLNLRLITGYWHVIEILQHRTDEKLYHGEKFEVETCPSIYITVGGLEDELKLYWNENEGDVEYRFKTRSSPGLWVSTGAQNGTLAQLSNYDQFAGTVYVRKAVNDHMVLTFCSPNTQLYSLVVFREKMLDPKELRSITNQMQRLKFPITQTKRTCRNTSSITQATVWLITVLGFAHVFFHVTK